MSLLRKDETLFITPHDQSLPALWVWERELADSQCSVGPLIDEDEAKKRKILRSLWLALAIALAATTGLIVYISIVSDEAFVQNSLILASIVSLIATVFVAGSLALHAPKPSEIYRRLIGMHRTIPIGRSAINALNSALISAGIDSDFRDEASYGPLVEYYAEVTSELSLAIDLFRSKDMAPKMVKCLAEANQELDKIAKVMAAPFRAIEAANQHPRLNCGARHTYKNNDERKRYNTPLGDTDWLEMASDAIRGVTPATDRE